jgi:hypothetical protein
MLHVEDETESVRRAEAEPADKGMRGDVALGEVETRETSLPSSSTSRCIARQPRLAENFLPKFASSESVFQYEVHFVNRSPAVVVMIV